MYHTAPHTSEDQDTTITIRVAGPEHSGQLRRLAERDSSRVPSGVLLVGLVDEQVRAAVAVRSGRVVADPFYPTRELVALLSERAQQLRGSGPTGLRARVFGRRGGARPALSPQPAGTLRAFE